MMQKQTKGAQKKKLRILPAFSWKNRMVGPASEKKMVCKHTTVFQVIGKIKAQKTGRGHH
jgi:hypothetical protein